MSTIRIYASLPYSINRRSTICGGDVYRDSWSLCLSYPYDFLSDFDLSAIDPVSGLHAREVGKFLGKRIGLPCLSSKIHELIPLCYNSLLHIANLTVQIQNLG